MPPEPRSDMNPVAADGLAGCDVWSENLGFAGVQQRADVWRIVSSLPQA